MPELPDEDDESFDEQKNTFWHYVNFAKDELKNWPTWKLGDATARKDESEADDKNRNEE